MCNSLAFANVALVQVQVFGDIALAVLNKHIIAVSLTVASGDYFAVACSIDRRASRGCVVYSAVGFDFFMDRVLATQVEIGPRNRSALVQATDPIPKSSGLYNESCSLMPVMVFTADHKATTINEVIGAVKEWRRETPVEGVTYRLASGNVGIWAATNEVIAESELPMMLAVYAVIIILVFGTYRDWRATVCCCLPLTLATFLGYWFMKELQIGLKVATLPVMVLAVGIGVDYAFYIFSRLQVHINEGMNVTDSYRQTLLETGNAVIFTAITLAIGVSTWSLSELQFQADMGLLLTFMFMVNMIGAVTALPALAVILDMIFPRKTGAKVATGIAH